MLKQVCPELFPLADYQLNDLNSENRNALNLLIRKENEKIRLTHSELGQVFQLCPKPFADESETIRLTNANLENELRDRQIVMNLADEMKQKMLSEETRDLIKKQQV